MVAEEDPSIETTKITATSPMNEKVPITNGREGSSTPTDQPQDQQEHQQVVVQNSSSYNGDISHNNNHTSIPEMPPSSHPPLSPSIKASPQKFSPTSITTIPEEDNDLSIAEETASVAMSTSNFSESTTHMDEEMLENIHNDEKHTSPLEIDSGEATAQDNANGNISIDNNGELNPHSIFHSLPDGEPGDDNSEFGTGEYSIADSLSDVEFGQEDQLQPIGMTLTSSTGETSDDQSFSLEDENNEIIIHLPTINKPVEAPKERVKTIRFSAENTVHHFTKQPEEFHDNPWLSSPERATPISKFRHFLAFFSLPFLYGASINITSLYFLLEMKDKYNLSDNIASLWLMGGYVCEIVFASLTRWAPKTFSFIGTLCAVAGFTLVYVSQTDMPGNPLLFFTIGSILTNGNETLGAMQIFVRNQHRKNAKVFGKNLSNVYMMTKLGEVCGFASAGAIYHMKGIEGLVLQGAATASSQALILMIFLFLDRSRHDDSNSSYWNQKGSEGAKAGTWSRCCCRVNLTCHAARGRRRIFTSGLSKINRSLTKHYPSELPQKLVRSVLPLCNIGSVVSSTLIWGIAAHVLKDSFKVSKLTIGIIFMCAAFADAIISAIMLSETFHGIFKNYVPCPRNLMASMMGISIGSLLIAIPYFPVFVTGFILFSICNSALSIVLIEMQGSSADTWEPTRLQSFRRILTAGCLYSLLHLYTLHSRLPLVLAFWMSFMTTVLVMIKLYFFRDKDENGFDIMSAQRMKVQMVASKNELSSKPEQSLTYAEQVMLGWLIRGKEV